MSETTTNPRDIPVWKTSLSKRTISTLLWQLKCSTLGEVADCTAYELLTGANHGSRNAIGAVSLGYIKAELAKHGLTLSETERGAL